MLERKKRKIDNEGDESRQREEEKENVPLEKNQKKASSPNFMSDRNISPVAPLSSDSEGSADEAAVPEKSSNDSEPSSPIIKFSQTRRSRTESTTSEKSEAKAAKKQAILTDDNDITLSKLFGDIFGV